MLGVVGEPGTRKTRFVFAVVFPAGKITRFSPNVCMVCAIHGDEVRFFLGVVSAFSSRLSCTSPVNNSRLVAMAPLASVVTPCRRETCGRPASPWTGPSLLPCCEGDGLQIPGRASSGQSSHACIPGCTAYLDSPRIPPGSATHTCGPDSSSSAPVC